jgi:hypothetical protein
VKKLRVETEAVLRGPAALRSFIHEFGLVPVPEPGTAVLLAIGLIGLCGARARRIRSH